MHNYETYKWLKYKNSATIKQRITNLFFAENPTTSGHVNNRLQVL